jgi:hypothetical protein
VCMLGSHVTHSAEVWGSILTLHTLFCGTLCNFYKSSRHQARTVFQKCKYLPLNQFEYGPSGLLGQSSESECLSRVRLDEGGECKVLICAVQCSLMDSFMSQYQESKLCITSKKNYLDKTSIIKRGW